MSQATDTFERDLRAVLHSAIDGTNVPLGVPTTDILESASRTRRRRNMIRTVGGVAAVSILASGIWVGVAHHGTDNLQPGGPPTTVTMLEAQTGGSAVTLPTVRVVTDARGFTITTGADPTAVIGTIASGKHPMWLRSQSDPTVRYGIVPPATTLPQPWPAAVQPVGHALTLLGDGSAVFVMKFASAADAAQAARAVTFSTAATTFDDGRTAPMTTLDSQTDLVAFLDSSARTVGIRDGLLGGPEGVPVVAAGALKYTRTAAPPATIRPDGAALASTQGVADGGTTALDTKEVDVVTAYGVVPKHATGVSLWAGGSRIQSTLLTGELPGTDYLAFYTSFIRDKGKGAPATSVSWTDPTTGAQHTHRVG